MARILLPAFLFLFFYEKTMAITDPPKENSSCYKIEPATLTGVIVGDVALTVLVVVITYFCASRRRQRKENAEKVYMNVRANCKA